MTDHRASHRPASTGTTSGVRPAATGVVVSVCIPAYNHADLIVDCIESALAQEGDAYEVVVIDDGSADDTVARARSVVSPRLRVIRNERNVGAAQNHNRCLTEAAGRFVLILHADDLLKPGALRVLREALAPGGALAFGRRDVELLDEGASDDPWRERYANPHADLIRQLAPDHPEDATVRLPGHAVVDFHLRSQLHENAIGEPSNVMLDRELALRLGGFRAPLRQFFDADMWLRMLCHGDAMFVGQVVAVRRIHSGTLTTKNMTAGRRDLDREWMIQGILREWRALSGRGRLRRQHARLLLRATRHIALGRFGPRLQAGGSLLKLLAATGSSAAPRTHSPAPPAGGRHR